MKWIGQHIWSFISRFRSDVYLEATETGTIASGGNLGLDSNNKIVKAAEVGSSVDLTSEVTGVLPVANGGTGASSLTDNALLTGTGTSAVTAESTLTYDGSALVHTATPAATAIGLHSTATTTTGYETNSNTFKSFASTVNKDDATAGGETNNLIAYYSDLNDTTSDNAGTTSLYGMYNDIDISSNNGTIGGNGVVTHITGGDTSYGLSNVITGATTSVGLYNRLDDGTNSHDLYFQSSDTSTLDYFSVRTGASGATTIETVDGDASGADLTFDIDGDIVLDSATGIIKTGSTTFVNNSGVIQVATQGTIDHDSLANYAANEHYTQANIVATGTIASGTWEGTAIADTYVANDLTISGGTVNNSVIGGSTPAAITGTTIDANTDFTVGTTVITDDQIQFTPSTSDTATISAGSNGSLNITTADASGSNATIEIVGDGTVNTTSLTHRITKTYDFHSTTFENNMIAGKPDGIVVKYEPNGDSSPNICQVYYLRANGAWLQADADGAATSTGLLAVGTGSSSQTIGLMIRGFMRIPYTEILNVPGSGAVDGLPVYLGTEAGHFDFTAPSASGDIVRILGYAIDDHDDGSGNVDVLVYFDPDKSWIEIA
tara:strand:- start:1935 stop:3752 length:1818 start_codon:yes stop_codon:yes gene_type:complete